MALGRVFNDEVGRSLAALLGNIPIVKPGRNHLRPGPADCVETGEVRVIGGIRAQNFDVGYRPDGVRFAYDGQTLNILKSVGKNWQNIVNDLATEAATVHSRFPLAIVGFIVAIPTPCLTAAQGLQIVGRLEGLSGRFYANDPDYMAEAVALAVWDPATGTIEPHMPDPTSPLRIERFSQRVEDVYVGRYGGLPPH